MTASFLLPPLLAGSPCTRRVGPDQSPPRPSAVLSKVLLKIPSEPALGRNLEPELLLPLGGPQRPRSSSGLQGPGSAETCPPLPSLRSGSSLVIWGKSFLPQGCACVPPSGSLSASPRHGGVCPPRPTDRLQSPGPALGRVQPPDPALQSLSVTWSPSLTGLSL